MYYAEKVAKLLKKWRFYGIIGVFLQVRQWSCIVQLWVYCWLIQETKRRKDFFMVDYLYYKKEYLGKVFCEKTEFERYEILARRYINSVINSKAEDAGEGIFYCICAVAEQLFLNAEKAGIKSENLDGYSVTYSGDERKKLYEILRICLPAELLFKGVAR